MRLVWINSFRPRYLSNFIFSNIPPPPLNVWLNLWMATKSVFTFYVLEMFPRNQSTTDVLFSPVWGGLLHHGGEKLWQKKRGGMTLQWWSTEWSRDTRRMPQDIINWSDQSVYAGFRCCSYYFCAYFSFFLLLHSFFFWVTDDVVLGSGNISCSHNSHK